MSDMSGHICQTGPDTSHTRPSIDMNPRAERDELANSPCMGSEARSNPPGHESRKASGAGRYSIAIGTISRRHPICLVTSPEKTKQGGIMHLIRFRSAAITCVCAAIAVLIAPTAQAAKVDYVSDPSEPSLSARVAELTQGRSLAELSATDFSELMTILPADGTVVEVVRSSAKKALLSTQVAAARSGTSVCTTSSQSVYIRQSSGYGGVGGWCRNW